MEINKNLRIPITPSNDLYRRDVRSKVVNVPTGKFTRNCVLTGKSASDMEYPIYIRTPGIVSPVAGLTPEGLGYFEASEGTASNVFPMHKDFTSNTTYWSTSTEGAWISYCHPLRPTTISSYRFVTNSGYTPNAWRIEGSLDNINWTILHSVTATWSWIEGRNMVQYDIPLENRGEYKYHRLVIETLDSTEVRIYSLQFFDSLCPHKSSFYLDADAENPIQLAFADGYNIDGSPKDILFTINTGIDIDMVAFIDSQDALFASNPLPCILYVKYDPSTSSISFVGENQYSEDAFLNVNDLGIETVYVNDYTSDRAMSKIFDNNLSTYAVVDYGYKWEFKIYPSRFISAIYRKSSGYDFRLRISEDNGATWNTYIILPGDGMVNLDRVYSINRVYIDRTSSYNCKLYEFRFYEPGAVKKHKFTGGEIYEYDVFTEQWNKVYKIPLGYFSLWRNPDNTAWEIGPFIPTHIPQMTVAPFFRKSSGGVTL